MADTFTAPTAGTYHLSPLGAPHLVTECDSWCAPFPDLPAGSVTHLEFDQVYLRRPELNEEDAARFAAEFDAALKADSRPRVLVAPSTFTDFREFYIGSDSRDDSAHWSCVVHEPCGIEVFSGEGEPTNPNMATIYGLMTEHRCPGVRAQQADGAI